MIVQVAIAVLGFTAIWLSQAPRAAHRRYACLFGLASQPFFFWATYDAGQAGMFLLALAYTWAWCRGLHHHWIGPDAK